MKLFNLQQILPEPGKEILGVIPIDYLKGDDMKEYSADFEYAFGQFPGDEFPQKLVWKNKDYKEIKRILRKFHLSQWEVRINKVYLRLNVPDYEFNEVWNEII